MANEQWGTISAGTESTKFAISFKSSCYAIVRGAISSTNAAANILDCTVKTLTKTGFTHRAVNGSNYFIAIGE